MRADPDELVERSIQLLLGVDQNVSDDTASPPEDLTGQIIVRCDTSVPCTGNVMEALIKLLLCQRAPNIVDNRPAIAGASD
jgi:hypothetical protein